MRKPSANNHTPLSSIYRFLADWLAIPGLERPLLAFSLTVTIPAFYLTLDNSNRGWAWLGHGIYLIAGLLVVLDLYHVQDSDGRRDTRYLHRMEVLILLGLGTCAWPVEAPWSQAGWLWRLVVCGLIFARLAIMFGRYLLAGRLFQIMFTAICACALAGAGFLWLEPKVHSYADGVWLAFVTAATVGYGDLVPSTPASRILAVFIVLLGYALFSAVTANIAALLVGEDEKRLGREMHADLRQLRKEIAMLRTELLEHKLQPEKQAPASTTETSRETVVR